MTQSIHPPFTLTRAEAGGLALATRKEIEEVSTFYACKAGRISPVLQGHPY